MTCTPIKLPGGGVAIVCGRGLRAKPCIKCGLLRADRLCDGPAPAVRSAGQNTCDAPLCTRCRRIFVVGRKIDLCPACAEKRIAAGQKP